MSSRFCLSNYIAEDLIAEIRMLPCSKQDHLYFNIIYILIWALDECF